MCGIVGVIAKPNAENFKVIDFILEGLKLLEYRGYDSAGLVLLESLANLGLNFSCFKELGKIANLEKSLVNRSSIANNGIHLCHFFFALFNLIFVASYLGTLSVIIFNLFEF